MQRELYYKSSNKANSFGLLGLLLITVIAGSALSILYLFLVQKIPSIKLTVLLTLVLGGVMGALGGLACSLFKIRNRTMTIAVSVIGILIYTYIKWAAFVSYAYEGSFATILPDLLLNPIDMLDRIKLINEVGTWSFGRDGDAVTGIVLVIIWMLEFLIYAGLHLYVLGDKAKDPFIEKDNKWAKKFDAKFIFRDFDVAANRTSIENDPGFLLSFLETTGNIPATGHVEAEFFHSSDFSENYLNVNQVVITDASKNNRDEKKVIKMLAVSKEFINNLLTQNGMSLPG